MKMNKKVGPRYRIGFLMGNLKAKKAVGIFLTYFLIGIVSCLLGCMGIDYGDKDSDKDGIFDRDEFKLYTDPKNQTQMSNN